MADPEIMRCELRAAARQLSKAQRIEEYFSNLYAQHPKMMY